MKAWWKSKTIWLNTAAGGVAFLATSWDAISAHLPTWAGPTFGAVLAAANVGLRFVTSDPITLKQIDQADGIDPQ
jgi:hypothetical protein